MVVGPELAPRTQALNEVCSAINVGRDVTLRANQEPEPARRHEHSRSRASFRRSSSGSVRDPRSPLQTLQYRRHSSRYDLQWMTPPRMSEGERVSSRRGHQASTMFGDFYDPQPGLPAQE